MLPPAKFFRGGRKTGPSPGGLYRDKFRRRRTCFSPGRFFRGRFHFATPADVLSSHDLFISLRHWLQCSKFAHVALIASGLHVLKCMIVRCRSSIFNGRLWSTVAVDCESPQLGSVIDI